MNQYEFSDEELDPIDPLKALQLNHSLTQRLKEQKYELMAQARKAGYSFTNIAKALGQTEAAIRMFCARNDI